MRRNSIRWRCLVTALAATSGVATSAEWQSGQTYDDIANHTKRIAAVTNDDGHSFGLYQVDGDEGVWVMLGLPGNESRTMGADQFPIIRVDNRDPIDTTVLVELENMGGGRHYHFSPNSFYMYFPSTQGVEQGTHFIYDLMVGSIVKSRYWTDDGSAVRVEFPLTGSRQAIARTLDIQNLPSPSEAARNERMQDIWGASTMECSKRHSPHLEGVENPNQTALELCIDTANACSEIAAQNPQEFYGCFDQHVAIYKFCANYSQNKSDRPDLVLSCFELRLNQTYPNYAPYTIGVP